MEWAVIDMMVDASSDCFVDAADILLKLKTDEAKVRSWPEKTGYSNAEYPLYIVMLSIRCI